MQNYTLLFEWRATLMKNNQRPKVEKSYLCNARVEKARSPCSTRDGLSENRCKSTHFLSDLNVNIPQLAPKYKERMPANRASIQLSSLNSQFSNLNSPPPVSWWPRRGAGTGQRYRCRWQVRSRPPSWRCRRPPAPAPCARRGNTALCGSA